MFYVTNGVRQGGILSPTFYNEFIKDLSVELNKSNVGCFMNGVTMNHLLYADDTVLLSPSPSGLQKLLHICEIFGHGYELEFNIKNVLCSPVYC